MLVTEEDIAFSLEHSCEDDLFFFYASLWAFDTLFPFFIPPQPAPLALSSQTYP
jgi:hypothetical protein